MQQVVQNTKRPPDEIVLVVQVMATAAVVNRAKITPANNFMLFPCLNDKSSLLALQTR